MRLRRHSILAGALFAAPALFADITSTSGSTAVIAPPADVTVGALESDLVIHAFTESRGTTLTAPLAVDITAPGVYGAGLTPGTIPPGTVVHSYLLHADQLGALGSTPILGSITFEEQILGVIVTDSNLDASDGVLGDAATSYPTSTAFRGLSTSTVDELTWSGRTISLDLSIQNVIDQVRVVTRAPRLVFSLDIGSDAEFSDSTPDGNEVFDPGDVYLTSALPGITLEFDDASHYGSDPFPTMPIAAPYGNSCVGVGGESGEYEQVFDLDGYDRVNLDLGNLLQGQPILRDSLDQASRVGIHYPDSLILSFEDDTPDGWLCPGNTPTEGAVAHTFGSGADEVVEVRLLRSAYPYTIEGEYPLLDELGMHPALGPNPAGGELRDDDVDALDVPSGGDVVLFSCDSEGAFLDDPTAIYEAGGGVVISAGHLGIAADVDIDAFELAWLPVNPENPNAPLALALLFSVDGDDALTAENERGTLDPNAIYASFLTGTHFLFVGAFNADVDGIAIGRVSEQGGAVTDVCGPGVPNSTGVSAHVGVQGSLAVADNNFTLVCESVPPGQFGYFLVSRNTGLVMPNGSQGWLCLGPPIGRLSAPGQIIVGPTGSVSVDLTSLPLTPVTAVLPGDTWVWQLWHREVGGSSNFSNALAVRFD